MESSTLVTVGVFQDIAWAEKGIEALKAQGFPAAALSLLAKDAPEVAALGDRTFGSAGATVEVKVIGTARAHGSLVGALQGSDQGLTRQGLAASAGRIGFQAHDGRIFETLVARGGVLVAVTSEPRAADALAVLHSYGGGNAAIGAWAGRL